MRRIFEIVISVCLITACGIKNKGIENSRWEHKIGDEIGYIEFSISNYKTYDAELGEHFYGTFELINDQVILYQNEGEFDDQFSQTSRHRTKKDTFEMIIKNKNQLGYSDFWIDNEWRENFYYTKMD